MNKTLLFVFFIIVQHALLSQTKFIYYPGYVIFKNKDTFFTKIQVDDKIKDIELSNLYKQVVYLNNKNSPDTNSPDQPDIIGYAFKKDTIQYNFHKLVLNNLKNKNGDKNSIFAWCMVEGYLKLYSYAYDLRVEHFSWSKTLYQNMNPNSIWHEYTKTKRLNYYVQKGDEELNKVPKNSDNSPNKKWLKSFLKDDKILAEKIGKEINIFDLETMVREYNIWYGQKQAGNQ